MRCAVFGCNSTNKTDKTLRFYSFPKDAKLLKQWVHFCRRKDDFNTKFARICSNHFKSDNFVRNLQFEMGLCKNNAYALKPGTVPSGDPTSNTAVLANNRSARAKVRNNKIIVQSLLKESEGVDKIVFNELNEPTPTQFEYVDVKVEPSEDLQSMPGCSTTNPVNSDFIPSLEIKPEPENNSDDSPPPSPITLYTPTQVVVKRKCLDHSVTEPNKSGRVNLLIVKPIMKDQGCQTDDLIQDTSANEKDKLIEQLQKQNRWLTERFEYVKRTQKNTFGKIPIESLIGQNKKVRYLTGFPSYKTMQIVFKDAEKCIPFVINGKMSKFDVFLMTWMKMKLDLSLNFLSILLNISCQTISKLFYETIIILYGRLSCYVVWPDDKVCIENTPLLYKSVFGERRIFIIDCFDIFCERMGNINNIAPRSVRDLSPSPVCNEEEQQSKEPEKPAQPVKYFICFCTMGSIIYLSKPFDTASSKRYIAENCGFLDLIKTDDIILANREFLIVEPNAKPCGKRYTTKEVVPMFKNTESVLEEIPITNSEGLTKIRSEIEKRLKFIRQRIVVLTNRPPVSVVIKKYGEEMYSDFVMKVACTIVNLSPTQEEDEPGGD